MSIILASASPRRDELLNLIKVEHIIEPALSEEKMPSKIEDLKITEYVALKKAEDVFLRHPEDIVIAADTIVLVDNMVLGKPKNEEDPTLMLKKLSNRSHLVVTAVAILSKNTRLTFHEVTKVFVDELTDSDIATYLSIENVYDKAGSYAIQGYFSRYICKIEGSYTNVMGLPVNKVARALKTIKND